MCSNKTCTIGKVIILNLLFSDVILRAFVFLCFGSLGFFESFQEVAVFRLNVFDSHLHFSQLKQIGNARSLEMLNILKNVGTVSKISLSPHR